MLRYVDHGAHRCAECDALRLTHWWPDDSVPHIRPGLEPDWCSEHGMADGCADRLANPDTEQHAQCGTNWDALRFTPLNASMG